MQVAGDHSGTAEHDITRARRLELTVLLLFIIPGMALGFFARSGQSPFMVAVIAGIFHNLALLCLVRFFSYQNGEPAGEIGWRFRGRGRDVLLGCLLFPPFYLGAWLLDSSLRSAGVSGPVPGGAIFLAERGASEVLLSLVSVAVVALAEETVFRGYLLSRLRFLARSTVVAVLLSSLIFGLGHGYEGVAGMVTVGTLGLGYALVYLWRNSLVAPITLHLLQDLVAVVILPLLR